MNTQNISNENLGEEIPQRAVSLYGQGDGVEDFPVLKAFQQYIDAEQEKSRKRIIGLSIFFGAILIVVVAVFLFLLHNINMRNQDLSDRFMEYAMKEGIRRQATPTVVTQPPSPQNEAVLKSMTETLAALQKKIQDSETAKAAAAAQTVVAPDPKMLAEQERIRREKESLEAEKKRLDEERERLRQIEIDRQRRKLYPELYEDRQSPSRNKTRMLTDDDIREIIREAYPDNDGEAKKQKKTPKGEDPDAIPEPNESGAIEYFKDDEYSIPVDVKGSDKKINFSIGM